MYKVFIDGSSGTTGLRIREYLNKRDDIDILNISTDARKNIDERLNKISEANISFLCLPDDASKEIAALAPSDSAIIDTSTAHRTDSHWVYGMAELCKNQSQLIAGSKRVSNPGCHASGFILGIKPLTEASIIPVHCPLSATSITGYSGGGKKMINEFEEISHPLSPGQYGLSQNHKHLLEMMKMTGLTVAPTFLPIVSNYYNGMVVTMPLHQGFFNKSLTLHQLRSLFKEYYEGYPLIKVRDELPNDGFIYSDTLSNTNIMEIFVYGNEERPIISTRFDNLGKGASGAAVQNMNIMLGISSTKGLI